MDSSICASEKRQRVVKNLEEALEGEDVTEKDFHIRQALQLLTFDEDERDD